MSDPIGKDEKDLKPDAENLTPEITESDSGSAEHEHTEEERSVDGSPNLIPAEDLTLEATASDAYLESLVEERCIELEETLKRKNILKEKCERLKSQLNESKQLLDKTREVEVVLTRMLKEKENERTEKEQSREKTDDGPNSPQ